MWLPSKARKWVKTQISLTLNQYRGLCWYVSLFGGIESTHLGQHTVWGCLSGSKQWYPYCYVIGEWDIQRAHQWSGQRYQSGAWGGFASGNYKIELVDNHQCITAYETTIQALKEPEFTITAENLTCIKRRRWLVSIYWITPIIRSVFNGAISVQLLLLPSTKQGKYL